MSKLSFSSFYVYSLCSILSLLTSDLNGQLTPGRCSSTNSSVGLLLDCGNADTVPQCITFSQIRDCITDCGTGLDEACPTGFVKCDGCKCVESPNRISMCFDHTNDKLCSMFANPIYNDLIYKCLNSDRCILRKWLLDSEIDCPFGDDENECQIWPDVSGCSTKFGSTIPSITSPGTVPSTMITSTTVLQTIPILFASTTISTISTITANVISTATSTLPSTIASTSTTSPSTTTTSISTSTLTSTATPTATMSTTVLATNTISTTITTTSPATTATMNTTAPTTQMPSSTLTPTSTTTATAILTNPTTVTQTNTSTSTPTPNTEPTSTALPLTTTTAPTTFPATTTSKAPITVTPTTSAQPTSMVATSTTNTPVASSTSSPTTTTITTSAAPTIVATTTTPVASTVTTLSSTVTTTAAATIGITTPALTATITTTPLSTTTSTTTTSSTTTTTPPTSTASVTSIVTANQATTITMMSTTSADSEASINRITVTFLLDDSTALNSLLANISDAIGNFAALMSPYEYDRLANYLLEVYTSSDSTLLGERFTGEDLITLLNSYIQSSGQRLMSGVCAKTNLTNLYRAFSSILIKATKNCVIYWFATSNTASVDSIVLDSILSYLTTKQCRIDVILYDVGCFNETLDTFDLFNKIARSTGGSVYKVAKLQSSPSQATLDDLFAIFAVQTLQPRLLLEKSQRFAKSTTVRFSVDRILTDLLIVVQGCNLNFNLRDNRGIYIPGPSDPNNMADFTAIVLSDQLCAFLINLNSIKDFSIGPGPGAWLLNLNSSCPVGYEIEASGQPDFKFYFVPKNSNFSYERPIIGTETHVGTVNPDSTVSNLYVPNQLQFIDFSGIPFEGSLVNRTTLMTNGYLTISDSSFYIKVSGSDPFGDRFQRHSRHPFYPEDISAHIQNTAQCKGQFDCSAMGGPCLPFSVVHDCIYACPNGADEGCFTGTQKCGCTCIPDSAICPTNVADAECLSIPNIEFFKCFSDGACIPSIFVGDGFKDCSDNSDEMPQNFDECSPNNHGFTANLCSKDAVCSKISGYDYFCSCKSGFWGDGFFCTVSPTTVPPITVTSTIYFTKLPILTSTGTTKMPFTVTSVALVTTTDIDPLWSALYSAKCPGQFDCGLGAGNCTSIKNYRDCKKDCPNGIDEACFRGYVHCDGCKCVIPGEAQTLCSDWKSDKFCSSFLTDSYTCKDGNGCIYVQWIMDGVKDCADGSDEDPKQWDLCKLGLVHCDPTTMACASNITDGSTRCVCIPGVTYSRDGFKTCVPI